MHPTPRPNPKQDNDSPRETILSWCKRAGRDAGAKQSAAGPCQTRARSASGAWRRRRRDNQALSQIDAVLWAVKSRGSASYSTAATAQEAESFPLIAASHARLLQQEDQLRIRWQTVAHRTLG